MTHIQDPFSRGSSLLHRLDPRVKIVAGTAFSFLVALSERPGTLLPAAGFSLVLLLAARLPAGEVFKRLAVVNGFILFLWLILPWTVAGETLYVAGPLKVSREGIHLAALITLKCNTILMAFLAFFSTDSPFTLFHALSHLHVPNKIVQLFFFCGRYIHLFMNEYQRLRTAMKIRGFQPRTNVHTYRSYGYLVGMLLVRSVDRSERIYRAMLCRGFAGEYPTFVDFRVRRADWLFAAFFSGLLLLLLLMEWTTWLP